MPWAKDGSVRFFKDGYTDLRGRFDYASVSTEDLAQAERAMADVEALFIAKFHEDE